MSKKIKIERHKVICQLRYEPSLSFYSDLYTKAAKIDKFPHWETDRLKILFKDFENRCSLSIAFDSIAYEQDCDNPTVENENISLAINDYCPLLGKESFTRFGYRQKFLIPLSMYPNELSKLVSLKLYSQADEMKEIIAGNVFDATYVLDWDDGNYKFHILATPMIKGNIPRYMNVNLDKNFDKNTAQVDYAKIINGYPDVSFFIDLDCFKDGKAIEIDKIRDVYTECKEISNNKVNQLVKYLFE